MHKIPSAMIKETATSDKARIDYDDIDLLGVQPSVFDAALESFQVPYWTSDSALSLGE